MQLERPRGVCTVHLGIARLTPRLVPQRFQRLKLKCDKPLSSFVSKFAFNGFNLRHYDKVRSSPDVVSGKELTILPFQLNLSCLVNEGSAETTQKALKLS